MDFNAEILTRLKQDFPGYKFEIKEGCLVIDDQPSMRLDENELGVAELEKKYGELGEILIDELYGMIEQDLRIVLAGKKE